MEAIAISDVRVEDILETPYSNSDHIGYEGPVSMSATVPGNNGSPIDLGFTVDIESLADVQWESDESPSGWNYRTDSPTYTRHYYAVPGDVKITSVSYSAEHPFIIDNEEVPFSHIQDHISPQVLKQLLNTEYYSKIFDSMFAEAAKNIDPPEPDFDEPYDSRY